MEIDGGRRYAHYYLHAFPAIALDVAPFSICKFVDRGGLTLIANRQWRWPRWVTLVFSEVTHDEAGPTTDYARCMFFARVRLYHGKLRAWLFVIVFSLPERSRAIQGLWRFSGGRRGLVLHTKVPALLNYLVEETNRR
jgi:hypothetical protein